MRYLQCAGLSAVFAAAFFASAAAAQVTVNVIEIPYCGLLCGGIDATATGSLDLTGLTLQTPPPYGNEDGIEPAIGYVDVGQFGIAIDAYSGLTGPTQFGPSTHFTGPLIFDYGGTPFAIDASGFGTPYILIESGYVSGAAISGTAAFPGSTFASLGLTPGQYVFTAAHDTVTVNIAEAQTVVPEPSTWATMLLGFAALGAQVRRRKNARHSALA